MAAIDYAALVERANEAARIAPNGAFLRELATAIERLTQPGVAIAANKALSAWRCTGKNMMLSEIMQNGDALASALRAMLAAAPQPPADHVPDAGKTIEQKTRLIGVCQNCGHEHDMGRPCAERRPMSLETAYAQKSSQCQKLKEENDRLIGGIDRCYKILLAEPNAVSATNKAEDMLRVMLADHRQRSGE